MLKTVNIERDFSESNFAFVNIKQTVRRTEIMVTRLPGRTNIDNITFIFFQCEIFRVEPVNSTTPADYKNPRNMSMACKNNLPVASGEQMSCISWRKNIVESARTDVIRMRADEPVPPHNQRKSGKKPHRLPVQSTYSPFYDLPCFPVEYCRTQHACHHSVMITKYEMVYLPIDALQYLYRAGAVSYNIAETNNLIDPVTVYIGEYRIQRLNI